MRILLFVLTSVFTAAALSAQPILGVLERSAGKFFLSGDEACPSYSISPRTNEALLQLRKLNGGDEVTASGSKDPLNCTVYVESIDYVGLRRMLGTWYSKEGVISVRDFSQMSFYPTSLDNYSGSKSEPKIVIDQPVVYNYSVTPTEGKEWVLFLSDASNTFFATILFTKGPAIMKIYDSENGALTKTLRLSKWGSGNK